MNCIADYRDRIGISQAELAERLGVSQPTVSDWESRKKIPTGDNLVALANEMRLRPSEVIADFYDHVVVSSGVGAGNAA